MKPEEKAQLDDTTKTVNTLKGTVQQFLDLFNRMNLKDRFFLTKNLVLRNAGLVIEGDFVSNLKFAPNYVANETGANNAITCILKDATGSDIPLVAGLEVKIKLAHTLQAGANTFAINGGTAKNIKSHNNVANNIGTAYAVGSIVHLMYDGTQWQDMSQ